MWAAGLSLVLVAVALVALLRDPRHEVHPRPVEVARASPAQASEALASFVAGVAARDAAALTSLAPPDAHRAEEVLSGIADNAASLDLRGVTARYVDQAGRVSEGGSWAGVVELTWRFEGFDRAPSRAEVVVGFAPDGEGLGITGFGVPGTSGRIPLWLRGPLSVARAPGVLVLVDGDRAEAATVARRVARGRDVVRAVLPAWGSPVVVEVPGSATDLDEALGAHPGTYAGIAAVTTTPGESTEGDAPVHVFVNPEVTAGLRRAGAQVVMSHELVHVATDAVRSTMEPWLLEGFADYVALRDTALPERTTLGRAIDAARRDGVPAALPTAADFDTRAADLQAAYEQAWLACRVIAERLGERGLLRVYDDASSGRAVTSALTDAGLPERALTRAWQERLRGLAG